MRDYYNHDLRFIILTTVAVVFLILVMLLRAIVAPLYLVGTVILSYLSSLGVGVLVLQILGGNPLAASMPGMAFIVLVAVGADYNMLLISRIRDESPVGIRSGVIRTVRTTGGVITSAGIIFAAPMFAMLFSSISSIVQAGFVIGVGLLLDTFVVRTITVPALAVLVGRNNWWPSGGGSDGAWPRGRLGGAHRPRARRGARTGAGLGAGRVAVVGAVQGQVAAPALGLRHPELLRREAAGGDRPQRRGVTRMRHLPWSTIARR